MNELIEELSKRPFDPEINFKVAVEYERINQIASAISFYLRTAEYGYETHSLITYNSLLKLANCFESKRNRRYTVSNYILQAIAYDPTRPEGYFLLSRFYEQNKDWQECYAFAEVGLAQKEPVISLPASVEYLGRFCLTFEKAVSGWWIGRSKESAALLQDLLTQDLPSNYRSSIEYNLKQIGAL